MRVADPLLHYRRLILKQEFAMEFTLPVVSEQGHQEQRRDPRRSVRKAITLRMLVADKAGFASGQAIDMTTRGCGLRLTKPLTRGQYLTVKRGSTRLLRPAKCLLIKKEVELCPA
jgi:hypothetical protein